MFVRHDKIGKSDAFAAQMLVALTAASDKGSLLAQAFLACCWYQNWGAIGEQGKAAQLATIAAEQGLSLLNFGFLGLSAGVAELSGLRF